MQDKTIVDVRYFWESNPLFAGESAFPVGSQDFFEEHSYVYLMDCFAGQMDQRIFPEPANNDSVLDLGCGPGFWTIELARQGAKKVTAADLTLKAILLTLKRVKLYGIEVNTSQQNAEQIGFADGIFTHVNCQGVIHHTPDTEACLREIARVLRFNGTALISIYYKNIFLRLWPLMKYFGKVLLALGGGLKGRGREGIYSIGNVNELVRMYDGEKNPIGKAFSKQEFLNMLSPYFLVEELFFHFFPARSLPFRIPGILHRFLDKKAGFLIFAKCRKRP